MNEIKKVVGINLIIMLIYGLVVRESGNSHYHDQEGILFGMAVFVTLHVILNIILSFIFSFMGKPILSRAFSISSGIVLLVGFSSCWVNVSI